MAKKSRFWGNFWGETGRNTGKWASNKVFGPAGWATPRRHIFDGENSTPRSRGASTNSGSSSSKHEEHNWSEQRVDGIIDLANQIGFDSNDIDEICAKLDDLLTGARTANKFIHSDNMSNEIFVSKIKSGIMRLRRNKEPELAEFYAHELKKITRSGNWSKAAPWIFIVFGVLFILAINYFLGNFD